MKSRYELIVFDWDGTLMDSVPQIVASMRAAGRRVGLGEPDAAAVHDVVGLALDEALAGAFPAATPSEVVALAEAYREHWIEHAHAETRMFEGALEVLDGLKARGHRLAVATGKSRAGLARSMEHAGVADRFVATRCADETTPKPDPAMLLELMAELGVLPSATLMVGDSELDLEMASAAGVAAIGVAHGVHSVQRLRRHSPLAVVQSLRELLDVV